MEPVTGGLAVLGTLGTVFTIVSLGSSAFSSVNQNIIEPVVKPAVRWTIYLVVAGVIVSILNDRIRTAAGIEEAK